MTALLAANLIAPLQRNTRVALAAQVRDDRAVHGTTGITEGVLGAAAQVGDLVLFAGHGGL